ncbi:hypothetical protein TNCT_683901 [Trichonephila clavata]|uniref:Uncharacterized protein n=1 Tax=Trichonephila clavata TaxID=2740835 RepID=A0A8X6L9Z1_TRICU|nr:hypothetical protein TNCT_683901 [Trichonephila clavata]
MHGGSGSGCSIYRAIDPATGRREDETRPHRTGQKEGSGNEKAGDKKNVVGGRKTVLDDGFCNLLTSS